MQLYEFIEPIRHASSYGSGYLKSLQNDILPELDLLVREAIQNSTDAALKIQGRERVGININVREFVPEKLNSYLVSLKGLLNERYPEQTALYMEIRDIDTSGLTGPVRLTEIVGKEDHGNYWKLVFDTGKEQTGASNGEAGGSWGYGKSVYYRIGIGLVIYYTRISSASGSEERLIFSLTEHETDENSLLSRVNLMSIGRAWWGKKDVANPGEVLPLTDPAEIQEILDIFGIERFPENRFGTSIIIPYINKSKLLEGIFPEECGISPEEQAMCTWKDDIESYLRLAVEKWYAPRLHNLQLPQISGQKWIALRINDEPITTDQMRPFFRLVQEMYNAALCKCQNKDPEPSRYRMKFVQIPSFRVKGQSAGWAAVVNVSAEELGAGGGIIKPYTYLRLFNKSEINDPIVMFARAPGMVLDYKIDGPWAKGMPKPEKDDEFLLVFFVPDCLKELKDDQNLGSYKNMALGEYLRKCEKSDHMDWIDKSTLTIVERIKSNLAGKVRELMNSEVQPPVGGRLSRLSGKIGSRFLPPVVKTRGGGGGGGGGGGVTENLSMVMTPNLHADCLEVSFELTFKNGKSSAAIGAFVEREDGPVMDAEKWEKEINDTYPLQIEEITEIELYSSDKRVKVCLEGICNGDCPTIRNEHSEIGLLMTQSGKNVKGFTVRNDMPDMVVRGKMRIRTNDRKLVCAVNEIKSI